LALELYPRFFFWKHGDSNFSAGLMATKKFFHPYGTFFIGDEYEKKLWEDKWLGNATL
jgi:hypothetical protein